MKISLHRHDHGFFYPGESGAPENIGKGKGEGFNINIGWNTDQEWGQSAGNNEYIYAFERIVIPLLKEFEAEIILIASGFDSHNNDPLGCCKLDYDGYSYMT